jgi:hypothetical protein
MLMVAAESWVGFHDGHSRAIAVLIQMLEQAAAAR